MERCCLDSMAQNRDQWQAVVNMVMNLVGSIKYREYLD